MRILKSEQISWKFQEPDHFPCFICRDRKATIRTTVLADDLTCLLAVCPECNNHDAIFGFWMSQHDR